LLKVAYKGEAKQLEEILDANPELNVNDREPKTGNTALFIASSQGKLQCVQYLLDRQADVNARNYDNCSPLVASVRNGSLEVTELLLECQNVDLDAFTKDSGFSALHFACSASRQDLAKDLAKLLLDKGADPNPEIMERPTKCPLYWAVCRRNLDLVEMLVEAGAKVKGQGLIELAKIYRSVPILQYLKEKGAD
jgi:ankyrin repeat protein